MKFNHSQDFSDKMCFKKDGEMVQITMTEYGSLIHSTGRFSVL